MSKSVIITGVERVVEIIERSKRRITKETLKAQIRSAEIIGKKADYYCPKDTLALVNSRLIAIEGSGINTVVRVTYGGPDAPYALWVHEDPHKHHDAPTCFQWLTRAERETRGTRKAMAKQQFAAKSVLTKEGEDVT